MPRADVHRFTPEERALLNRRVGQILGEREAREWADAISAVLPTLATAVTAAAERELKERGA